jgi:hypothetical protein
MAAKKHAIEARVGHAQGIDDIGREIGKAFNRYRGMRLAGTDVMRSAKKAATGKNSVVANMYGHVYKNAKANKNAMKKFNKTMKRLSK